MSKERQGGLGDYDGYRATSSGRKKDRRDRRHDSKHHLNDIRDLANSGKDFDDLIEEIEEDE